MVRIVHSMATKVELGPGHGNHVSHHASEEPKAARDHSWKGQGP